MVKRRKDDLRTDIRRLVKGCVDWSMISWTAGRQYLKDWWNEDDSVEVSEEEARKLDEARKKSERQVGLAVLIFLVVMLVGGAVAWWYFSTLE